MTFPIDASKEDVETAALNDERSKKYIDGKTIVKVIVVPKKIVNIVCKQNKSTFVGLKHSYECAKTHY